MVFIPDHRQRKEAAPALRFVLNNTNQKTKTMGNLLYAIAVILIIAWTIGFFAYQASGLIHLLLVIAIVAILLRVIRGRPAV